MAPSSIAMLSRGLDRSEITGDRLARISRAGGDVVMPSFLSAVATLPASDLTRARAFYEQTLGLEVGQESPGGGGVLDLAGTSGVFVYPSELAGTNQTTAVSFLVDDLGAMVAELRGRGVTFEEYDLPGLKTENGIAEAEGERRAWSKDTEGNILAVIQGTTG
jgi:predicted enzyme related to lactoylglutathione lyase